MKVLYIGSGKSAKYAISEEFADHTIVCLNNAWRLFENVKVIDYWIHTGDFPEESCPKSNKIYNKEICYKDYSVTAKIANQKLNWQSPNPEHYAGYTAFFQGLYWILLTLNPDKVGLLGFDHDYNNNKVEKWLANNKPNIQNDFNKKKEKTIKEWSDNFFHEFEEDFFYGHGTPDPLMLGEAHIIEKMNLAQKSSKQLGIELINYSPIISHRNPLPKDVTIIEKLCGIS